MTGMPFSTDDLRRLYSSALVALKYKYDLTQHKGPSIKKAVTITFMIHK